MSVPYTAFYEFADGRITVLRLDFLMVEILRHRLRPGRRGAQPMAARHALLDRFGSSPGEGCAADRRITPATLYP